MDAKRSAAEKAVQYIKEGMTIGLGSGSTASYAIQKIGELVKQGLKIKGVATSLKTEKLAKELGIPIASPLHIQTIDLAIDGADEADSRGNLIKGGGGSLLREKIIAYASKKFYVIIDESKLVHVLGKFPLAVEVVPFGSSQTIEHLKALGCDPGLRKKNGNNFITDNGNLIVDCLFGEIADPAWLDVKIKMIPGVVETGLFSSKIVTAIIIGYQKGDVREIFINH